MNIGNMTGKIGGMIGKAKFALKLKSPEILLGAGIIFVVGGTVMACRATEKAKEAAETRRNEIAEINDRERKQIDEMKDAAVTLGLETLPAEKVKEVTKETRSDKLVANVKFGWTLTKLYAPAVILEAAGIGCFIGSHTIIQRRYTGAVAAYEATNAAYKKLKEKYEKDIKALPERSESILSDEKSAVEKELKELEPPFDQEVGRYSFCFDELCNTWQNDALTNYKTAKVFEEACNARFRRDKYLLLNDVRECFGMDCPGKSPEGMVIGWAQDMGDTYIDFGLDKWIDSGDKSIWITPNCTHMIMRSKWIGKDFRC